MINRIRVAYVPTHAHDDINHKDVEYGLISSENLDTVFVRFEKQVDSLGWDNACAVACYRRNIMWMRDGKWEPYPYLGKVEKEKKTLIEI